MYILEFVFLVIIDFVLVIDFKKVIFGEIYVYDYKVKKIIVV